jgi:hypothetical protein
LISFFVLCKRKLLLPKSLFLDKNLIKIDWITTSNFHFAQCLFHWMGKYVATTPAMAAEKTGGGGSQEG